MLKTVHSVAYWVFVASIVILTLFAVLYIWDVFGKEVFWKSVATIGVITFSSGITMTVTHNFEKEREKDKNIPNPPLQ